MTEEEWWPVCGDPSPMLSFLEGKASDRKLRLFAVGCCRGVWDYLVDERSREAVLHAEGFAGGGGVPARMGQNEEQNDEYYRSESRTYQILCECVRTLLREPPAIFRVCRQAAAGVAFYQKGYSADAAAIGREEKVQCKLLRDVF